MPLVRLASAPSTKATTRQITSAKITPTQGSQPSLSPFDPESPTALPTMNPATPNIRNWPRETIPP